MLPAAFINPYPAGLARARIPAQADGTPERVVTISVPTQLRKRFIEIGEVVGQKNSSFILFEDKYVYLGVDFAWHYDKNTYRLRPVLLSEGTIKLKNLPEELSCVIISNN